MESLNGLFKFVAESWRIIFLDSKVVTCTFSAGPSNGPRGSTEMFLSFAKGGRISYRVEIMGNCESVGHLIPS